MSERLMGPDHAEDLGEDGQVLKKQGRKKVRNLGSIQDKEICILRRSVTSNKGNNSDFHQFLPFLKPHVFIRASLGMNRFSNNHSHRCT